MSNVNVNLVIRRSHAKSRNGCQTCKTRRIKCDEFRPRCRNCTLANRLCKYPITANAGSAGKDADSSSLTWPAVVDTSCQRWQESGKPPFPHLELPTSPSWHGFSMQNLRYIHHLGVLASVLELSNTRQLCSWWGEFSLFIQLALKYDFVGYANMSQSAGRLAIVTKSGLYCNDCAQYRILLAQGLRQAIDNFSKENADAIICASICLSSLEPDWRTWRSIMEGISAILSEIDPWQNNSAFAHILDYAVAFPPSVENVQTQLSQANFSTGSLDEAQLDALLAQGIASLNRLAPCPKDNPSLSAHVRQLRDVLRLVSSDRAQCQPTSIDQQFRLIHPFTALEDPYHTLAFDDISATDPVVLAVIAHSYAVVLTLAVVFPAVDLPIITAIRVKGIFEADRLGSGKPGWACGVCRDYHWREAVMEYPLTTVALYRERNVGGRALV